MFTTLTFIALFVALPIMIMTATLGANYPYMFTILLEFGFATKFIRVISDKIY